MIDRNKVIVITQPGMISKTDLDDLTNVAEVHYVECDSADNVELAALSQDYDCLMLNYDVAKGFSPEFYELIKGTRLKMISCDITGMSWAFPKIAKENNIILCNTPNYCTDSVAEHILAQILLHSRKIHIAYLEAFSNNLKKINTYKGFNLNGKQIGILGAGNIGLRLAEIAHGIGMKPVFWNHKPKDIGYTIVDLDTLCEKSDVIAICVKTTEDTIGMINKSFLLKCKKNCIFVNQAGEQLVIHDDMYDFLKENVNAGYSGTLSLEIINSMLYELPNATFQPPNAWCSEESLMNLRRIWVNNVVSYFNGRLENCVYE